MSWLVYRRRRWLVGFTVALGAVLAWAGWESGHCAVVVYNESSRPLGPVRVELGAITADFPALAAGESVVRTGWGRVGGAIGVWLPEDPPRRLEGPWVEPRDTAQVVVRIEEFGTVFFSQEPAWQARLISALR